MKITTWKKDGGGTFINVNPQEALLIIKSLSAQMLEKSSNSGRAEFQSDKGYFSIAVEPGSRKSGASDVASNTIHLAKSFAVAVKKKDRKFFSDAIKALEKDLACSDGQEWLL